MDLKSRLEEDLKDAMRKNEAVRRTSIRSVLAAIKLAQVEKEKGTVLDDAAVLTLVQKEIKSRKESIADAEKAHRPDLISGYEAEIAVLEDYLPKQLSKEELTELVKLAIQETGAVAPTDLGKVMKVVIPRVQGRAPNDQISATARALLVK
jgi:uncharacterized protein YqeY